MTRLTSGGSFLYPIWTPDGRYVVFDSNVGMFWTRADGTGKPQPLTESKNLQSPGSFSPDGKRLAFVEIIPRCRIDLWTVALESEGGQVKAGKPEIFLQTSASVRGSLNFPLTADVRAIPDRGKQWQISNSGVTWPLWSRNTWELFYHTEDQRIMVVNYTVEGDSFVPDKPRLWAEKRLADIRTSTETSTLLPAENALWY
jgi:Tol biopolymer transport system component